MGIAPTSVQTPFLVRVHFSFNGPPTQLAVTHSRLILSTCLSLRHIKITFPLAVPQPNRQSIFTSITLSIRVANLKNHCLKYDFYQDSLVRMHNGNIKIRHLTNHMIGYDNNLLN